MRSITIAIGCISLVFLANFGDKSQDNDQLLSKNLFGTVKLIAQTAPIAAEKITISGRNSQSAFSKPTTMAEQKDHMLTDNPKNTLDTVDIKLDAIDKIIIPQPAILWKYKKNNRETEYIEIEVVSKGSGNRRTYLIESRYKVVFYEPEKAGFIRHESPLAAIEYVDLQGCRTRDEQKTKEATSLPKHCGTQEEAKDHVKK